MVRGVDDTLVVADLLFLSYGVEEALEFRIWVCHHGGGHLVKLDRHGRHATATSSSVLGSPAGSASLWTQSGSSGAETPSSRNQVCPLVLSIGPGPTTTD